MIDPARGLLTAAAGLLLCLAAANFHDGLTRCLQGCVARCDDGSEWPAIWLRWAHTHGLSGVSRTVQ